MREIDVINPHKEFPAFYSLFGLGCCFLSFGWDILLYALELHTIIFLRISWSYSVMEQKQAKPSSNLDTSNVTVDGSSRRSKIVDNVKCPNCAGPLSKEMETSQWTISPLIRDSFSMIGSAVGGIASAFYGFNHVMPIVQRRIKGPMLMHFLVGAPPVIVFSSACAGLAGGAVPALAQLASSSYHAVVSSSSIHSASSQDDNMSKSRSSSPL